jgi:glucosamine--fructose-6-phosphate aminotransferase (isomerizing)
MLRLIFVIFFLVALSRLEYRGYDSAGIAVVGSNSLHILKCVGAPTEHLHANKISETGEDVLSTIGIGHNRWATHGKPTLLNAHPHTDQAKKIAVVHNGTILNYESLRKELQQKGIVFISETDTEVIPHLIATYKKEGMNMREAFLATLLRLEGAYGVVAFDAEDPHTLYVAKEGSPIVIGVNDGEYYVASSIHGFLPFTDRFITLLDGEMAVLSIKEKADLQISRIKDSTSVQDRMFQTAVHTAASDLSKGDFETFMLKEIYEQPATTRTTLVGRTNDKEGIAVLGGLLDSEEFLINTKTFLFTGCGTTI